MPSIRSVATAEGVGSLNVGSNPGPLAISAPTGLAAGDIYLLLSWAAQGQGNIGDYPGTWQAPGMVWVNSANMGTSSNRWLAIHAAKVVNPADFATLRPRAAVASSRLSIVALAIQPDPGETLDLVNVVSSVLEWSASAASTDTFPTVAGTLKLGIIGSGKSSSSTKTVHAAAGGGTMLAQAVGYGAASLPYADSVVSVTQGGTGITTNVAQANFTAYSIGITGTPIVETGYEVGLWDGITEIPAVATLWDGISEKEITQILSLPWTGYTVTEMDADIANGVDVHMAHRGCSLNWSEMTLQAYTNAIWWGFKVLEISCWQDANSVWWGLHGAYPNADVSITTPLTGNLGSYTTAALEGTVVDVPNSVGTLTKLTDLLAAYGNFVIIADNKSRVNMASFLDVLGTVPDATEHIIVKIDGTAPLANFTDSKARGYKTAPYFFSANVESALPSRAAASDYIGLNYDATTTLWDGAAAYGKPMWGHLIENDTMKATAKSKGAVIFQCAQASVAPQINAV
jgi:hypothetical protein